MKRLNQKKWENLWTNISLHKIGNDESEFIIKNTFICKVFSIIEFIVLICLYLRIVSFWYALAITLITRYIFWYFNLNINFFMFHHLFRNFPEMLEMWEEENTTKQSTKN